MNIYDVNYRVHELKRNNEIGKFTKLEFKKSVKFNMQVVDKTFKIPMFQK